MSAATRLGSIAFVAVLASGCAVSSPFEVNSTGSALQRTSAVALALPDDPLSERGRFSSALSKALMARSVRVTDDAPLIADFSFALGSAANGVLRGKGRYTEGSQEQDWITPPRGKRRFDKCEAQRLRATLVLYDRASGKQVYRGSGEGVECDFSDADIAALAELLVVDAVR